MAGGLRQTRLRASSYPLQVGLLALICSGAGCVLVDADDAGAGKTLGASALHVSNWKLGKSNQLVHRAQGSVASVDGQTSDVTMTESGDLSGFSIDMHLEDHDRMHASGNPHAARVLHLTIEKPAVAPVTVSIASSSCGLLHLLPRQTAHIVLKRGTKVGRFVHAWWVQDDCNTPTIDVHLYRKTPAVRYHYAEAQIDEHGTVLSSTQGSQLPTEHAAGEGCSDSQANDTSAIYARVFSMICHRLDDTHQLQRIEVFHGAVSRRIAWSSTGSTDGSNDVAARLRAHLATPWQTALYHDHDADGTSTVTAFQSAAQHWRNKQGLEDAPCSVYPPLHGSTDTPAYGSGTLLLTDAQMHAVTDVAGPVRNLPGTGLHIEQRVPDLVKRDAWKTAIGKARERNTQNLLLKQAPHARAGLQHSQQEIPSQERLRLRRWHSRYRQR
ncbi:MAG: hypothetical protein ACPGUV_02905 [Polyangiales bacterium]